MTSTEKLFVVLAKRADFGEMSERASNLGGLKGVGASIANEGSYLLPGVGSARMIADGMSDFGKGKIWGGIGNTLGGLASGALDAFSFGTAGTAARGVLRGGRLARFATKLPSIARGVEGARGMAAGLHGIETGATRALGGGRVARFATSGLGRSVAQSPGRPIMTPFGNANISPLVAKQRSLDVQRGFGRQMAQNFQNLPSQMAQWSNPMGREMNPMYMRPGEASLPFGMSALGGE